MIIIKDERKVQNDKKPIGVCESCKKEKVTRPVKVDGMMKTERGYYNICFDCFGSRIFWKKSSDGIVYQSPAKNFGESP